MLTRTLALATLLVVTPHGLAQPEKAAEVSAAIKAHLKTFTPELNRYHGLTTYGETLSKNPVSPEQTAAEVALLKQAADAGLLKSPSEEVFLLAHNVVIHDAAGSEPYWKSLHDAPGPLDRKAQISAVVNALAAGRRGEAFAIAELTSEKKEARAFWAEYLSQYALYAESVKPLHERLAAETDPAIKDLLVRAIVMIGSPASLPVIKELLDHTTDDKVQAAAIFGYAELAGFEGTAAVEGVKTAGPLSAEEKKRTVEWLKTETRADCKHGREVESDDDFIGLYGDLKSCPAIAWLDKEGFFTENALKAPPTLSQSKKKELLELLVDAKGFGLEAVKGPLFLAISKEDEGHLLRIREVSFYSPNRLSRGMANTVGIMVRHIRQEKQGSP